MREQRIFKQLLNIFWMKGLLSLFTASCTKDSREMRPLGEMSLLEVKFRMKVRIASPMPELPLLMFRRSTFALA